MTFKSRLHQRVQALRASISCSPLAFALIFAVLNSLLYQGPLYSYALKDLEAFSLTGSMVLLSLFVLNTMLMALLLLLLALITPRLLKPMAMVIALGNAVALYFIQAYQVVLDKNMMGNVFNTDTAEAGSYFSFGLVLHVVLYGLLPVCVIAKVALRRQSRWRTLVALLLTPVLGGGLLYANAQSWLWIDAHGRKLGGMVLPWSYAVNAARFQIEKKMQTRELAPLPDATFTTQAGQKTIVVLVIGESARAANFSLYGYERETNPALRSRGAVALAKARSCATYTTAAVQCMLADVDTSKTLIHGNESLPSYLQRHGVDTVWRTRNWGEPPIKVNTYDRKKDLVRLCTGPNCNYDEALLAGLAERIAQSTSERIFVVLHQHGSHGPDYFNRYPPDGEQFSPVCASVQLQDCTYETIVNAYDNSVLYTDRLLASVIDTLRAVPNAAAAMLYVSDHGESLGEYGLYLHGTPYTLAPDVQKDIPYIVWMSDAFRRRKTLAADQALAQAKHAQMTVFHSVMGAFDMRSPVYNPQLDIFANQEQK